MSSLFVGFIRHSAGFFPTGNHPKTLGNATGGRRSCARHWHRQTSPSPVIVRHKPITLLFPGSSGAHGGMSLSQMNFTAGYAVLGIELADAAAFSVHELTFGVQHLHEWVGISGFTRAEHDTPGESHIHYKCLEDQLFSISPSLSLALHVAASGRTSLSERVLREDTCLAFHAPSGLSLADCNELITAVRHMLHFAVLSRIYPMRMTAVRNEHGYHLEERFIPHGIELWNSIIRERVESEFLDERWVFRFSDVQPRFAAFFADWLKFCRDYQEALRCYSTTVYHRLPDSVEHLCLAQALEAYHGTKFGKQTFLARIRALAQKLTPHVPGLVPNIASFAEEVRDNRNYYTHHDPAIKQRGRVLSGAKLLRLNEKLRLLFQMCVLTEMKIPADRFLRLRRQLATYIIDYI